jgi:hypothetical protein
MSDNVYSVHLDPALRDSLESDRTLCVHAYQAITRGAWVVSFSNQERPRDIERGLTGPLWCTPAEARTFALSILRHADECERRSVSLSDDSGECSNCGEVFLNLWVQHHDPQLAYCERCNNEAHNGRTLREVRTGD